MRTYDCFKKRLLRRVKPDHFKVIKALEMAKLKEKTQRKKSTGTL
jgi:hypothetical protein